MTNPSPVAPVVSRFSEQDLEEISAGRFASFSDIRPQLARDLLAASGELERLKEALELAIAANAKMKDALSFYADDGPTPNVDGPWKATSWDFGAFARCTLADVANIEGGKNP